MTTHVSGQPVAATAPTLYLSALRRNLLAIIVGNPLFTPAEQLRANHNAHECEDAAQLSRWIRNTRRVAADRDHAEGLRLMAEGITQFEAKLAAGATAPAATPAQCDEVFALSQHPALLACEKAQAQRALFTLTHAQAARLIGKLWGKVLHRTGQVVSSDGSTVYAA